MKRIRISIPEVWYNEIIIEINDDKKLTNDVFKEIINTALDGECEDKYENGEGDLFFIESDFEYSHHLNPIIIYDDETDELLLNCVAENEKD